MSENGHVRPIRWRLWIGWGLPILLVLLFCAHAIWTSMAGARFSKSLAALKQAGEPTEPIDFAVPAIDPATNAGLDIIAAAALIDATTQEWKDLASTRATLKLPLSQEQRKVLEALSAVNSPGLQRLESARGKPGLAWEMDLSTPLGMRAPNVIKLRSLASAQTMQALLEHDRGNHRGAIDRMDQVLLIGRFAGKLPSLIGALMEGSTDDLAATWLQQISPDLRIGNGPNDVPPEAIRKMIGQLLEDDSFKESLIRGIRSERVIAVSGLHTWLGPPQATPVPGMPHPVVKYLLKPVYFSAGVRMIDYYTELLAATEQETWPAARAKLPANNRSYSPLEEWEGSMVPSFNGQVEPRFRIQAARRRAAVALAYRWYMADHAGQPPATLDELVPTYLPAVPTDPMAVAGTKITYMPTSAPTTHESKDSKGQ